jgi:RimJ/RimL family protein N-acetyltransferase
VARLSRLPLRKDTGASGREFASRFGPLLARVRHALKRERLGVFVGTSPVPVGTVTLEAVCAQGHAEIGYWIGERYWGRGLATVAVGEALHYAFTSLGVDALTARTDRTNRASQRVLEKCGFRHAAQQSAVTAASQPTEILFELTRTEWEASSGEKVCQQATSMNS